MMQTPWESPEQEDKGPVTSASTIEGAQGWPDRYQIQKWAEILPSPASWSCPLHTNPYPEYTGLSD